MTAHYTYTDVEMLDSLRSVASQLSRATISGPEYEKYKTPGMPARNAVRVRFGTWREAVSSAGLSSPTVKGGLSVLCAVCGKPFHGDRGKKARKTCSKECSKKLFAARPSLKGDASTPQAARGRARRASELTVCGRCGHDGSESPFEVHHRDRDPYNNAESNLEVLCRNCHKSEHKLAERACSRCGAVFQPKRTSNIFCSRRCAGQASADTGERL